MKSLNFVKIYYQNPLKTYKDYFQLQKWKYTKKNSRDYYKKIQIFF